MNILQAAGCASLMALACASTAAADVRADIAQALNDPRRPAEQRAADARRKPADLIAFAGIKPGDAVADVYAGNGYFTRILSDVVGPTGRIYAMIPAEMARNCDPEEFAGAHVIERDRSYANVEVLVEPGVVLATPRRLDVIWSSQNYHDLHDGIMDHDDVAAITRAFFQALKPGGTLLVIDHVAEAGSGRRDSDTLHRIDPLQIKKELAGAGFLYLGQSDVLRNPSDDHRLKSFDPAIRGRTDQVVLKFRKPS